MYPGETCGELSGEVTGVPLLLAGNGMRCLSGDPMTDGVWLRLLLLLLPVL
jgi:hypothetical protein